jgi:hypothetical protein
MLAWPLVPFLALPWLAASVVDQGETPQVVSCPADAEVWRAWIRPARPGYLWVRLDGAAGDVDIDLGLASGTRTRLSLSHRAQEQALMRVEGPVALAAWRVHGQPRGARVRLTLLPDPVDVPPGGAHVDVLGPGEGRLFRMTSQRRRRCRLRLTPHGDAQAKLSLTVFDEQLRPLDRRSTPATVFVVPGPAAERFVLVGGRGALRLGVEKPGKGVKSFPPHELDVFLDQLAATDEQRLALEALRRNPDFQAIRAYLLSFPGGSPLRLRVAPGLRVRGAERFGSFSRGRLTINPTIEGHTRNVQELMDTLIHELIHALQSLPRADGYPLSPAVRDMPRDPRLSSLDTVRIRRGGSTRLHRYLEREYGPSASNPTEDYIDINAAAQRLVAKVIEDNRRQCGLGHETLVFENIRNRRRLQSQRPTAETR